MKEELAAIEGIDMAEFGFLLDDIERVKEKAEREATQKERETEVKEIHCPRCGAIVGVE